MIELELDKTAGIAKVKPIFPLEKKDFLKIAKEIDPYIKERGDLNGLVIYSEHFPRWKNINAMSTHVKFVKNHHKKIHKVAAVTNSKALCKVISLTKPFLKAEVKYYDLDKTNDAIAWICS